MHYFCQLSSQFLIKSVTKFSNNLFEMQQEIPFHIIKEHSKKEWHNQLFNENCDKENCNLINNPNVLANKVNRELNDRQQYGNYKSKQITKQTKKVLRSKKLKPNTIKLVKLLTAELQSKFLTSNQKQIRQPSMSNCQLQNSNVFMPTQKINSACRSNKGAHKISFLSKQKQKKEFLCFDQNSIIESSLEHRKLLKNRVIDNDVDSDQERVELSVYYMQAQLMQANQLRDNKISKKIIF